jgi:hypothetical protein
MTLIEAFRHQTFGRGDDWPLRSQVLSKDLRSSFSDEL